MEIKYIAIALVVVAVVVIAILLITTGKYTTPTGPNFQELLNRTNSTVYTADYNYLIYSNIAGQVSTEEYLFVYSQRGFVDRYIMVTNPTQPGMSLYIVMAQLSNGTVIQCIAEPMYASCFPANQTFNLLDLALPIINASTFKFAGTQKILNYSAYCYVYRNTTALGNVLPGAAQAGLASLPVNVTGEVCMTADGVPLKIMFSAYTTLSNAGFSSSLNITQVLSAISVEDGVYLSGNATQLLQALGINATG